MFKSPIDFAENILLGKHTALFYENAEYARTVSFAFLESGMKNREHCFYFISGGDTDFFRNEFIETMFGPNVTAYEYNTNPNTIFDENLFQDLLWSMPERFQQVRQANSGETKH